MPSLSKSPVVGAPDATATEPFSRIEPMSMSLVEKPAGGSRYPVTHLLCDFRLKTCGAKVKPMAIEQLRYLMLDQVPVSDAPVFARGWKYPPTRPSLSIPHKPCGSQSAEFCSPKVSTGLSYVLPL